MPYMVENIEGIGAARAKQLFAADIRTTRDLLKSCCDAQGRKAVSEVSGLPEKALVKWVNHADLMRIHGIGSEFSDLLEAAGVHSVGDLRTRDPEALAMKMRDVNRHRAVTRYVPSVSTVTKWVLRAQQTDPIITY